MKPNERGGGSVVRATLQNVATPPYKEAVPYSSDSERQQGLFFRSERARQAVHHWQAEILGVVEEWRQYSRERRSRR